MSVETQAANLATAVNGLVSAVNTAKGTLDTNVVTAKTSTDATQDEMQTSHALELDARQSIDDAYKAFSSARAIANQQDLSALALSKTNTATDVFIYDTKQDSDGGAWRHRTSHTSWYNEELGTTTRGTRREFPAVAVIVAESNKVTIYDGDDPALPMWMVFTISSSNMVGEGNSHTLAALNGILTVGSAAYDLYLVRFIADEGLQYSTSNTISGTYKGNVSQRNDALSHIFGTVPNIGSRIIHDVAMTVLPDAPVDSATGLPIPTIAVATDGGVSVINQDGTVTNYTGRVSIKKISWVDFNRLFCACATTNWRYAVLSYEANVIDIVVENGLYVSSWPRLLGINSTGSIETVSDTEVAFQGWIQYSHSLAKLQYEKDSNVPSLGAFISSKYTTGYAVGDVKLISLADTETSSLVGGVEYHSDPTCTSTSTFASPGTDWIYTADIGDVNTTTPGKLHIKQGTNGNIENVTGVIPAGTAVAVKFTISNSTANAGVRVYLRGNGVNVAAEAGNYYTSNGTHIAYFPSHLVINDCWTAFFRYSGHTGTLDIDDISVTACEVDRSVHENGFLVNGTITRTPVATGAELVGYEFGGSNANYLLIPDGSRVNPGAGDFCVMTWYYNTNNTGSTQYIFDAEMTTGSFFLARNTSSNPTSPIYSSIYDGTTVGSVTDPDTAVSNKWMNVALVRRSGALYLYVDGVEKAVDLTASGDVSGLIQRVYIGNRTALDRPFYGKLALFRISTTAPTADQIKYIYEQERHLFKENAACTLYGSSDAVTGLAHDKTSGLLHVGTSSGRSTFQGLQRVDNTTTGVTTAISANDGVVIEQ